MATPWATHCRVCRAPRNEWIRRRTADPRRWEPARANNDHVQTDILLERRKVCLLKDGRCRFCAAKGWE